MLEAPLVILSVFGGIATVLGVPLFLVLGGPLLAWFGRGWLRVREREVAIRELEMVLRVRESQALPPWVDADDPKALLAWIRTDQELSRLTRPLAG